MNNPSPFSIKGKMLPAIKTQVQKNYDRLFDKRHSNSLTLRKKIKKEIADYNKLTKTLAGKSEIKRFHEIETAHRFACEKDKLKNASTRLEQKHITDKHKKAFANEVKRKLPQLNGLRKYRRALGGKLSGYIHGATTTNSVGNSAIIDIDDLSIFDEGSPVDPTVINFTPPYPLSESYVDIVYDNFKTLIAASRVDSSAGLLIHDLRSRHEDDAWFTHNAAMYDAYTAVGVNYIMPKNGIVSVDLFIQNLVNEHNLSLTDNFGLSEGIAELTNSLYVNIVHPNNIIPFEVEMNRIEITSDGDDVYQSDINVLDTRFPRWMNFRSTASFSEGTNIQIYAGSRDTNYSIMDDMDCVSDTKYSWFVRNIVVRTL